MSRTICPACGGTYDTVSSDGVPYYHACPPIGRAELPEDKRDGYDPIAAAVNRPGHRDENVAAVEAGGPPGDPRKGTADRRKSDVTK